jgi:hypothetical protein
LPVIFGAILLLKPQSDVALTVEDSADGIRLIGQDGRSIQFPSHGDPLIDWLPAG